jgi:hypothetical protein
MQRLQDQYFAALKRADAQYFEGVKRITDVLTKVDPSDETKEVAQEAERDENRLRELKDKIDAAAARTQRQDHIAS